MQKFEGDVEITHINVRKEGEEKETLALDIKMSMMAEAGLVDSLMCEDINDGECERCFWMANEDGTIRFPQLEEISFKRTFNRVSVEVMMMILEDCKLSKFRFTPMPGRTAGLEFQVSIKNPPQLAVDRLASMLANRMPVKFWQPQAELQFTDDQTTVHVIRDPDAGTQPDSGLSDPLLNEAEAFVRETGRASISGVQRNFRIGYNRAARLIEALEEKKVITPMNANGNRAVLAKH